MERRETLTRLRASLDGNDSFVSGGHGVISTAGATRHAERMKKVPVWALDDKKIKQFIDTRFPKAKKDSEQRKLATRIILIIHLYYRVGATAGAIAEELNMSVGMVKRRIYLIKKAMEGKLNPSHRPKNKGVSIQASSEDDGDSHISL